MNNKERIADLERQVQGLTEILENQSLGLISAFETLEERYDTVVSAAIKRLEDAYKKSE